MKTTKTQNNSISLISSLSKLIAFVLLCMMSTLAIANNAIESVQYNTIPGNRLQIILSMSEHSVKPLSFTIDNPARIAFDFANTGSTLTKRAQPIGIGIAQSLTAITAKNKTRVILNLTEVVPYQITTEGKNVIITLDSEANGAGFTQNPVAGNSAPDSEARFSDRVRGIKNIDFRRGSKGEGRVIVTLNQTNIPTDITEEFGKVVVKFIGAKLPDKLRQTLDVLDFATPVKSVSSFEKNGNTRIEITPVNGNFEHVAYQANNVFTIELKPVSKEVLSEQKKAKFGYTGERLSLNFQDIPVRAVLQLIADFTGLNIVVSDSVTGNVTLRLKNVPWDQALDIILKAKGLSKRESGNVVLVAPSAEIAAQEKIDLEASQAVTELAPLRTEYFTINFAKVTDLAPLFKSKGGGSGSSGGSSGGGSDSGAAGATGGSLLSPRGSVIVDQRTNTLIVKDTEEVINEVRRILTKLDVPIRQVMISSRIVIANDLFTKELGSRFGVSRVATNGPANGYVTSGGINETGTAMRQLCDQAVRFLLADLPLSSDRLNVNLPTSGAAAGSIAFAVLNGGNLLDLEISALQAENKGEIISSPRVVTSDRHEAFIEQGVEIPYLSASSSGATQVEFKKAVLSIKVTPHITPDDKIIMDLSVKKDAVGQIFAGIPSIDTREVGTQVLVNNADTIVLGGIYEQTTRNEVDKVPFLGDLPLIGYFFKHTLVNNEKAELLIFVTPKILKESLSL